MSLIYLKEQIADTFVGPPAFNSSDNDKECGLYVRNDLVITPPRVCFGWAWSK